jgi:hypothetical protein
MIFGSPEERVALLRPGAQPGEPGALPAPGRLAQRLLPAALEGGVELDLRGTEAEGRHGGGGEVPPAAEDTVSRRRLGPTRARSEVRGETILARKHCVFAVERAIGSPRAPLESTNACGERSLPHCEAMNACCERMDPRSERSLPRGERMDRRSRRSKHRASGRSPVTSAWITGASVRSPVASAWIAGASIRSPVRAHGSPKRALETPERALTAPW